MKKKKLLTPRVCPQCHQKLAFRGEGWGFCTECVAEIEVIKDKKKPKKK